MPREQEYSQDLSSVLGTTYHFNLEDDNATELGVWEETNLWPGLQTEAFTCDYWGETRHIPADTPVASPSVVPFGGAS